MAYVTSDGFSRIRRIPVGTSDAPIDARALDRVATRNIFLLELLAIYQALVEFNDTELTILSDSEGAVNAVARRPPSRRKRGFYVLESIQKLCLNREVRFMYVPREENLAGHLLERTYV